MIKLQLKSRLGVYLTSLIDFRSILVALALLHLVITQMEITHWYQRFGDGPISAYPDAALIIPLLLMVAALLLLLNKAWANLVALVLSAWVIYSVAYIELRSIALAHDLPFFSFAPLRLWLIQRYAGQAQEFLQLALAFTILGYVLMAISRHRRSENITKKRLLFVSIGVLASAGVSASVVLLVTSQASMSHLSGQITTSSATHLRALQKVEQAIKLLPVDEGGADPSFQEFRKDLLAAVKRHDTAFTLSVLHLDIENGYDIETGVDEFKKIWQPDDPKSSLWNVLSSILAGGGSFTRDGSYTEFCGPYVVSEWASVVQQLPKGTDSLNYVAIGGNKVPVRLEPKTSAPVVATLSYDVVRSVPNSQVLERSEAEFFSWIRIKVPSGPEGYVPDTAVLSPMDYGACFRRIEGKWVITKLAATE